MLPGRSAAITLYPLADRSAIVLVELQCLLFENRSCKSSTVCVNGVINCAGLVSLKKSLVSYTKQRPFGQRENFLNNKGLTGNWTRLLVSWIFLAFRSTTGVIADWLKSKLSQPWSAEFSDRANPPSFFLNRLKRAQFEFQDSIDKDLLNNG